MAIEYKIIQCGETADPQGQYVIYQHRDTATTAFSDWRQKSAAVSVADSTTFADFRKACENAVRAEVGLAPLP